MKCPKCGWEVGEDDTFCEKCGKPIRAGVKAKWKYIAVMLVLGGVLLGYLMMVTNSIPRNGLVGEYHFEGDTEDSSGNKNTGLNVGATFVQGVSGQALSFDGNGYVNIGNISQITSGSDWTVSFWMKSVAVENYRNPFDANFVGEGNNQGPRFEQQESSLIIYLGKNLSTYNGLSIDSITRDNWYHVVGVRNKNTLKVYLNNINKVDTNFLIWPNGFSNVTIGRGFSNNNPIRWFKGVIDEVRIYSRALNEEEIKTLYEINSRV